MSVNRWENHYFISLFYVRWS